jgi:hypothetical protein
MFLVKKFPGEKGSVKLSVAIMQQPVLLSPKFGAKSSLVFTVTVMRHKYAELAVCPAWMNSL